MGTEIKVWEISANPMVEAFRALAKDERYASEQAANTYGGSFRYWREIAEGKWKMILGVNVSGGRDDSPAGQLDLWIPVPTLTQVLGISDAQASSMAHKLPVMEMRGGDAIVHLKDERSAREVAKQIQDWFQPKPTTNGNT